MGQAEQRQVRTGVAARLAEERAVADVQSARLASIRERRRMLEEHDHRRVGLTKGLRAEVSLAILNADAPSDEAVAQAAGWSVGDVERLRDDLLRAHPGP